MFQQQHIGIQTEGVVNHSVHIQSQMFYHRLNCFRIICNYLNCQMLLVCAVAAASFIRTYTIKHSNLPKRKSCAVHKVIPSKLLKYHFCGLERSELICNARGFGIRTHTTHKLTSAICAVWKPIVSTIHHVCTHVHVCETQCSVRI